MSLVDWSRGRVQSTIPPAPPIPALPAPSPPSPSPLGHFTFFVTGLTGARPSLSARRGEVCSSGTQRGGEGGAGRREVGREEAGLRCGAAPPAPVGEGAHGGAGGAGPGCVEEGFTPATSAARGFARERRGRWAWLPSFSWAHRSSTPAPGGARVGEASGSAAWSTAASAMEETQPLPQSELQLCDSLIIWVSTEGKVGREDATT